MNFKKPKDCNCDFPEILLYRTATHHGEWCEAHKRLINKKQKQDLYNFEKWCREEKDAYGRSVAGKI